MGIGPLPLSSVWIQARASSTWNTLPASLRRTTLVFNFLVLHTFSYLNLFSTQVARLRTIGRCSSIQLFFKFFDTKQITERSYGGSRQALKPRPLDKGSSLLTTRTQPLQMRPASFLVQTRCLTIIFHRIKRHHQDSNLGQLVWKRERCLCAMSSS